MRLAMVLFFLGNICLRGQAGQAGYVLAAQGQWKWASNGNGKVSPGDPVKENSTARSTDRTAKLTIGMLDGTVKSFDCPPLNPCVASIGPFRKPPDSLSTRLFAVGKTFFSQRDAMPVYAMSRGGQAAQFQHAVLVLGDTGLDVSPAIKQLDPGIYGIRMRSIQGPATSYSAQVTWDPPALTAVNTGNLKPGAYELTFNSSDGMRVGSIPVILSTAERAAAQRSALEEGFRIVRSWPSGTDPAAIHNFLTAWLLDTGQGLGK